MFIIHTRRNRAYREASRVARDDLDTVSIGHSGDEEMAGSTGVALANIGVAIVVGSQALASRSSRCSQSTVTKMWMRSPRQRRTCSSPAT